MDPDPQPMPDFAAEEAFMLREGLMLAFGWNKEQAIQHLEGTWQQAHPDPVPPLGPPVQPCQDPQEDEGAPDQLREVEAQGDQVKQAQEKKKPTIGDFEEDALLPSVIVCQPLQYALQRIAAYEYIEMWYFTRDSCFEATKQAHSQADDAFGLLSTNKVLTLCQSVEEHQGRPRIVAHRYLAGANIVP